MVVHHLLFSGFENCETPGVVGVTGQCSCAAWFDMRLERATQQPLLTVMNNGFPPCPAVGPLVAHFEEELACDV